MKKPVLILLFLNIFFYSAAYDYENLNIKLLFSAGFAYDFTPSTDIYYKENPVFIEVPLNVNLDFRFRERFSLFTGLDLSYAVYTYNNTYYKTNIYFHNIFIRIPFTVKFYPITHLDEAYENFYIGLGLFLHVWVLNYYFIQSKYGYNKTGNAYFPTHEETPPGKVYTPANIGFKLSLGNVFYLSDKTLLGFELYASYLFIPFVNGYYQNINYNLDNGIIMDFCPSVGALFYIGVDLTN